MTLTATHTSAANAIQELIQPWTSACLQRDWDALLSMCTDDIVFMPPGAPAVTGETVRPWLDTFPTIKAMSWEVEHVEATEEWAFVRGPVAQMLAIDGKEILFDGKYCDLVRRGNDGVWRFAVIIWNANAT